MLVALLAVVAGCGGGVTDQDLQKKPVLLGGVVKASGDVTQTGIAIPGYRSDFTIARADTGVVKVTNKLTGEVTSYDGLKLIKFFDRYTSFDVSGGAGQVYRLYQAAFNRKPDQSGLGFWITAAQDGYSLDTISAGFIASGEFQTLYGKEVANTQFITLLYNNILHRAPEQGGYDWWVDAVNKGASRSGVLLGFSDSSENQSNLAGDMVNGIDYIPFVDPAALSVCKHTTADKPLVFNGYNVSTNQWNVVDDAGNLKPLPFTFTECASGKNLADNAISATWNWSLPQADWRYPESATNTAGYVKAFPEIIYGRQLYGATSTGSVLPMLVSQVNLIANHDVAIESDGIDQMFIQGTYVATPDSNEWLTSVTVMLRPTKVCMDKKCGNPQDLIETAVIDGITYDVYRLIDVDTQKNIPRYNVELIVKEDHLRGSMKMKSINDYLISKGWLKPDNYMNSIEMGTEIISGTGKTTVNHFSVTQ
jgi:hypothetical protein